MVQKELQPNIWHQMLDFHLILFKYWQEISGGSCTGRRKLRQNKEKKLVCVFGVKHEVRKSHSHTILRSAVQLKIHV